MEENDLQGEELPEFYTGSPVDSSDLRHRDDFIAELWDALRLKHVLLTAPRRTGKTSVMNHLRDFPQHGFTVIKENVQDLSHPADMFGTLLARFHDEHPDFLRDALAKGWSLLGDATRKVKEIGFGELKVALRESDPRWRENWREHGDKLLAQLRRHGKPVLILIDELPDMLLNLKEKDPALLREFLAWFRAHRMEPIPKKDPVRWLVGGSINFSSTLDAVGMVDLINDLDDMPLPVFSDDVVRDFVTTMLKGRGVLFHDDLPDHVVTRLGRPIPMFMQLLTQDLYRLWKKRPVSEEPLGETVDEAFQILVLSSVAQDKLQHYHSRLRKYYAEPLLSAAHSILGKLSLSSDGRSRSVLYQEFQWHLDRADLKLAPHESK